MSGNLFKDAGINVSMRIKSVNFFNDPRIKSANTKKVWKLV